MFSSLFPCKAHHTQYVIHKWLGHVHTEACGEKLVEPRKGEYTCINALYSNVLIVLYVPIDGNRDT